MPVGEARDMYLVYTDSGKVKSTLRTPLNRDYSNQEFPYMEFPDGLILEFFDEKSNKSVVTADYGILYSETNLVDLNGNVVLKTHDGNILEAPQLYWNQDSEWVFTEGAFKNWGYQLAKKEFGATEIDGGPWCRMTNPANGKEIIIKDVIADAFLQQILLRPKEYDVIATMNLNGDYISDALAAQVGGIGLAPGANLSDDVAIFEATHGTAKPNPL